MTPIEESSPDRRDGPRAEGDGTTVAMLAGVGAAVAAAAGALVPWFTSSGGELIATSAWGFVSSGTGNGGSGAWWDGHAPTYGDTRGTAYMRRSLVGLGMGAGAIAAATIWAPESRSGSKGPERLMHGGAWVVVMAAMFSAILQRKAITAFGGSAVPVAGIALVVAAVLLAFVGAELLERTRTSRGMSPAPHSSSTEAEPEEENAEPSMSNDIAAPIAPPIGASRAIVPPQLPSGLSIWALVLGLIALPLAVFALGVIPAILAIVFGAVALSRHRQGVGGRPKMATSGIITGSVALLGSIVVAAMITSAVFANVAEPPSGTTLLHAREAGHNLVSGAYASASFETIAAAQLTVSMESNVSLDLFVLTPLDFENYLEGNPLDASYCQVGRITELIAHTCTLEAGQWFVIFDHSGWGWAAPAHDEEVATMSYRIEVYA